jgi:ribosomal protein L29
LTPHQVLPVEISCKKASTYPHQLTRFGPAKFASRAPEHEDVEMQIENATQANEREMMMVHEMYANIQEYEQELAKERQQVSLKQLEQYAIPVQPRKHLNGDRPVILIDLETSVVNHATISNAA